VRLVVALKAIISSTAELPAVHDTHQARQLLSLAAGRSPVVLASSYMLPESTYIPRLAVGPCAEAVLAAVCRQDQPSTYGCIFRDDAGTIRQGGRLSLLLGWRLLESRLLAEARERPRQRCGQPMSVRHPRQELLFAGTRTAVKLR
jgi:hypothetical protein